MPRERTQNRALDHFSRRPTLENHFARSQDDAYFVRGFNAARDRLVQIDVWRRRGLGQLAEVFGPGYVEQDKATRLFLYRGDMHTEWLAYGPDVKRVTTAFVSGIHAYIDYLTQHPERMPYEFKLLGYRPARWRPENVVRVRSHGLTRNLQSEVARARVVCVATLHDDAIRVGLQPPWEPQVPEGLEPCLPKDVLSVFTLAIRDVHITREARKAGAVHAAIVATADTVGQTQEGSNNSTIAPMKSATGRPILANDPHPAYATPSLRYIACLVAPGLNVIGAGEPAVRGVLTGHNGAIAFGSTIFNLDQEDLYVY